MIETGNSASVHAKAGNAIRYGRSPTTTRGRYCSGYDSDARGLGAALVQIKPADEGRPERVCPLDHGRPSGALAQPWLVAVVDRLARTSSLGGREDPSAHLQIARNP